MIVSFNFNDLLLGTFRTVPTIESSLLAGVDCSRGRQSSRTYWTTGPHFFVPTLI